MKIVCNQCKKTRMVRVDPKHESKDSYKKRRPICIGCGHKKRIQTLGGHAPGWRGGRIIDQRGYVRVWIDGAGYRKEHQIVWEKENGAIPSGYVIHHKDENKLNNSIKNFECLLKREHDKLNKGLLRNHWNRRLKITENLCAE